MKHVGKMKNNGSPVAIVFRTLPGDPLSCLLVGTQGLGPTNHDALMSLIETPEAQSSNELADILAARLFPDGSNILGWLHTNGKLKKVPTEDVLVLPAPGTSVPLDELNKLIAEQKGITLEQLAGGESKSATSEVTEIASVTETPSTPSVDVLDDGTLAKRLRSQADAMFKEAQSLRKQADELDPPKKKTATKKEIA
jgi:hypothetical protein